MTAVIGPQQDRRARRRAECREQVYVAAIELFVQQGYDDTTMEQVAQRADVARATVFNHFPRKVAFLDEWTTRRRRRAAGSVRATEAVAEPLDAVLAGYLAEMARLSEETRAETVALMTATSRSTNLLAHPVLADEIAGLVRGAKEAGETHPDTDPDRAGRLVATAYFATLSEWIAEEPPPFDLREELSATLRDILHGISAPARAARATA